MTSPDYIPPHLEGRLSDFRDDGNGMISFKDVGNPSGTPDGRRAIDMKTFRATFDPSHRATNIEAALKSQYSGRAGGTNLINTLRDWTADKARGLWEAGTANPGRSLATVGGLGGLIGAGLGAFQSARNDEPMLGRSALYGLLGAGLGTGALALMQHLNNARQKSASSVDAIEDRLDRDHSIGPADRELLVNMVQKLAPPDRDQLAQLLRVGIGAGAGAIVVRFLRGKGLLPMLAGSILGGLAAAFTSGPRTNAFGRPVFS